MLNIQKQGLRKGLLISQVRIVDNHLIMNNGEVIGRVYQDKFNEIITFHKYGEQKAIINYFKEAFQLEISLGDIKELMSFCGQVSVYKIEFILFGGSVWNLLG